MVVLGSLPAVLSFGREARGLPFIRTYSLDEIGKVPRAARLGFDSFGRFAVMYDGIYTVLNDTAWVDRIDAAQASRNSMTTIRVVNGVHYYGGRASWGIAEQTDEGTLRARSLVPPDAPAWTAVTPFNEILATRTGVYFYEFNGVVYWDFASQRNQFFELSRVVTCFRSGERVFVSSEDRLLREILPGTGTNPVVPVPGLENAVVERAVPLDGNRTLLALRDGRLLTFDGQSVVPWPSQKEFGLTGRILSLVPLAEGGVALSLADQGVFIFSAAETLRWRLPLPEFRLVGALAANEPGVLWAMGENALYKIFYNSPLTSFGLSLGLTAAWPRVVAWGGRLVVCSGRTVYESASTAPGAPSRFQPLAGLPAGQIGAVAAQGSHLLAADTTGVLAAGPDGGFRRIAQIDNAAKLVFIAPEVCVVIGGREIIALRHANGQWSECAPRIAGVGDAPVRTMLRGAVWIELGGNDVARLTLRDGLLNLERISLPWQGGTWTNLGAVGRIVILSGAQGNRAFYDEAAGAFCDAPDLKALLNRSPYWIARVTEDESGTLWATHTRGIVTFTPENGGHRLDATTYELRNDSYPEISELPDNSIWVTSGRSLYRVEREAAGNNRQPDLRLVSMRAEQGRREMLPPAGQPADGLRFSYDDSSLSFRFFSGTYAWRSPPLYQYRLGTSEPWTPVDASMVLRFPKLREGDYRLEVRQAEPQAAAAETFTLRFAVAPPWYRTPLSYAGSVLLLLVALIGVARWTNHRSLKRNAELEQLVHERTRKLEVTMEKLNDETRNAATLAERSRLAGEIHDSLQQGLSGTLLHLETTLTHPSLTSELRAQLGVMRNMLSYSREEVQQAVWNLGSPLLQHSTLDVALHKLAGYINAGPVTINVVTPEGPVSLEADVQHNLLRIAQEAITNAVKHARARHIGVALRVQDDAVFLSVTDDGCGFDTEAGCQIDGHFGLRGIRARASSISAALQIISAHEAGTTIQVCVTRPPRPL
jgi:signal transduction histidine kinase